MSGVALNIEYNPHPIGVRGPFYAGNTNTVAVHEDVSSERAREFAYWLQGFLEVHDVKTISEDQLADIRLHLSGALNVGKSNATFFTQQTFDFNIPVGS